MIAEAGELRKKITSGVVSPDDARRALVELRQRHRQIAAHVRSIKIAYDVMLYASFRMRRPPEEQAPG